MAQLKRTAGRSLVQAAVSKITGRTTPAGPPTAATPGNKVGMTAIGDRTVAQVQQPTAKTGEGSNRVQTYTFFTKASGETEVLYNGDRLWTKLVLTLETAGPVAVGTSSSLSPILSGKGILLKTDNERSLTVAKGSRIYIASSSVNRVSVVVEALPWLEQITATLLSMLDRLGLAGGNSADTTKVNS